MQRQEAPGIMSVGSYQAPLCPNVAAIEKNGVQHHEQGDAPTLGTKVQSQCWGNVPTLGILAWFLTVIKNKSKNMQKSKQM